LKQQEKRKPREPEVNEQMEARRRVADQQAKRIPWRRLQEMRNEYVACKQFYFWARSIMEASSGISPSLATTLRRRLPGFMEHENEYAKTHNNEKRLPWQRLSEWIDEQVFESPLKDGWLDAVTFYAVRDPRYQRAAAYWAECQRRWKRKSPPSYPTFKAWTRAAEKCSYASLLHPEVRLILKPSMVVPPQRFSTELERYVDWHAFVYWCRSALEAGPPLPRSVSLKIAEKCPAFLREDKRHRGERTPPESWNRLVAWGQENLFQEARNGGWFDALVFCAGHHARKIRTEEYWAHWKSEKTRLPSSSYPSFEAWRQAADDYIDEIPSQLTGARFTSARLR